MKCFSLDSIWQLTWQKQKKYTDYPTRPDKNPIPVNVPGDIHLALMHADIIGDPQISDNSQKIAWIRDQEWWFCRSFEIEESSIYRELVFEGLDYQAQVFLNGKLIAEHMNVYRPLTVKLSGKLRKKNTIAIRLLPYREDCECLPSEKGLHETNFGVHHFIQDQRFFYKSFMRKFPYTFGWNWTQPLATCGIWKSVYIRQIDSFLLEDCAVLTTKIAKKIAHLQFVCNVRSTLKESKKAIIKLEFDNNEYCFDMVLAPGRTHVDLDLKLKNARLWWPRGYGESHLYEAQISIIDAGNILTQEKLRFGVRTVEIDESPRREADHWQFAIKLNGEKIFAKGGNWVPPDTNPARITDEKRQRLLQMACECNMNYLRVWGGGMYESDKFYELCDEFGLMVWQDFMFSCSEYPDYDDEFVEEIKKEVEYQSRRLRKHPSIVMWCGNNEIAQQKQIIRYSRPNNKYYGQNIFESIIPEILSKIDRSRPYVESSGCIGSNDKVNGYTSYKSGVCHQHNFDEIFKRGKKKIPSFLGEWYTAAAPPLKSINQFLPEKKTHSWLNKKWLLHDFVSFQFVRRVDKFVHPLLTLPFEKTLYYFSVLQAEMHKAGIEMTRFHKGECWGNVIWMYADAFTGMTRTIVDYYCRRKMAFFSLKRAFAPVIIAFDDTGDTLDISIVNDLNHGFSAGLCIDNYYFSGKHGGSWQMKNIEVKKNSSIQCIRIDKKELAGATESFIYAQLYDKTGKRITENRFFLDHLINLAIPDAEVEIEKKGKQIKVKSKSGFIRNFHFECGSMELELSDNYFDLAPLQEKTIEFTEIPDDLSWNWENNKNFKNRTIKRPPVRKPTVPCKENIIISDWRNKKIRKFEMSKPIVADGNFYEQDGILLSICRHRKILHIQAICRFNEGERSRCFLDFAVSCNNKKVDFEAYINSQMKGSIVFFNGENVLLSSKSFFEGIDYDEYFRQCVFTSSEEDRTIVDIFLPLEWIKFKNQDHVYGAFCFRFNKKRSNFFTGVLSFRNPQTYGVIALNEPENKNSYSVDM